jgi:maltose phosphorylase
MNINHILANEWSIVENSFDRQNVPTSESIFSIGNGYMGQRANFEEDYSGKTLQGTYIGGIYYPDKTRVGWWKNGYPEYFAKVLNAPNWIGISIKINGKLLDLNKAEITDFYRELNMKEGWLKRSFTAELSNGNVVNIEALRFVSMQRKEIAAIQYNIKAVNFSGGLEIVSYIDAGIKNKDANYDEYFWKINNISNNQDIGFVSAETLKTSFGVCTAMQNTFMLNGKAVEIEKQIISSQKRLNFSYQFDINQGEKLSIFKYVAVTQTMNYQYNQLEEKAVELLSDAVKTTFNSLLEEQATAWQNIWKTSDIEIVGDVKAQQAIRFNIFQLNQTYTGEDARLNIGPKGFTGEKYGGSTYWDTEAYCIPFYMSTKDKKVAKNLLLYRYNQLDKAIENAEKLGFNNGAALYPMVTMNGEECHNEWEITFEEIHRNGAMVYAIYNYVNYTGDYEYVVQNGMEVIIAIARFWAQRVNFSAHKNKYVILGVTGPNEYENNVNNNWYTNYLAKWTLQYALENINRLKESYSADYERINYKTKLLPEELKQWKNIAENMYFPYDEKQDIYLQQDGFLDKEIVKVAYLPQSDRPINQKWSWDKILRSCYIKQADLLQGMYFFEHQFDDETLTKHFDFYEPLTVHESSLSPCVHSILASKLNKDEKAYEMYLRTARLDLDDYNNEVDEGLHITSMAGTWLSVVQGFGGMRNFDYKLSFSPKIPKQWQSYAFKINYNGIILQIFKSQEFTKIRNLSDESVELYLYDKKYELKGKNEIKI